MDFSFHGTDGALLFVVRYFAALWYFGAGDKEYCVDRGDPSKFSLDKAIKVVWVCIVPYFGILAAGEHQVLFWDSYVLVDYNVCLVWGCSAFGHGLGGEGYRSLVGVGVLWYRVDIVSA